MTRMMTMVTVEIGGKICQVPEGITAVQALWYSGHPLVKGIGCLGGVCGACTFTYRRKGKPGVQTGLACQTLVEEGMGFSPPASIEVTPAKYRFPDVDDPKSDLLKYYPETRRCTRCNACTMVCPQSIDVRACVLKALSGEFDAVSELFYSCVMCGLCTMVCDIGIRPNLVALYARRSEGVYLAPRPKNLLNRLQEMESGAYASKWQKILQMNEGELQSFLLLN
jgi:succinate dehydrogenase/fumarate reductase-like Fe-S protein